TWVATANAVAYCGATPVFVDVDRETFNMDPASAARGRTPRTRAVIAVHLFGLCADMDALAEALPGVHLIEDAACAAGAAYRGRSAGSLGKAAAFSFHARKVITTGEGGMITTNDPAIAAAASLRRSHGARLSPEERHRGLRPYLLPEFDVVGFNYRMTDLQGALGSVQLSKLDRLVAERRRWAAYYDRELARIEWLRTPPTPEGYEHSWQAYVLMVDESRAPLSRNDIMEALLARGIDTRPGTHAVHRLGCYRGGQGGDPEGFPAAADCERLSIAIPLHNRMSADDYATVVSALRGLA
ncbi:MAG: DegT/DnrJ/EryC1/StrS family aminotransferase, partial [Candidatus Binatia bacterium]